MDNPQVNRARKIVEYTHTNLFLTGRAGTGKTTFLRRLRQESFKRMVVLAPTGIAAINANGVTLHSFFQLPFAPYVPGGTFNTQKRYRMSKNKLSLIRSIDLLVIDEISMVRADVLDAVDDALRRHRRNGRPFGGVQLLLIGDLQQLAPVVKDEEWELLNKYYDTPYFFSSKALQETQFVTVELEKVYRQSDERFLALLNAVREGSPDPKVLQALNSRYQPNFEPDDSEGYIRLVTHNWKANEINVHRLHEITQPEYEFTAKVEGNFPELAYPTDFVLTLKLGTQVMFVKNDSNKRYYNGMIGEVVSINEKGFAVRPKSQPNELINVEPEEWVNARYILDEKSGEIKEEVDGRFVQMPVKLAWAITIHKSQGLTFDRVMIDAAHSFAHGQTYVALSRCRTLEGIVLTSPIPPSAIIADDDIDRFSAEMRNREPDDTQIDVMRNNYGVYLLSQVFNFQKENDGLRQVTRLLLEFLSRVYGETAAKYEAVLQSFASEVMSVATRFHAQYQALVVEAGGDLENATLQERVRKGAEYFRSKLVPLFGLVQSTNLDIDNAQVDKRMKAALDDLRLDLHIRTRLLEYVMEHGFHMKEFMSARAQIQVEVEQTSEPSPRARRSGAVNAEKVEVPSEVKHPELYRWLKSWRAEKGNEEGVPLYRIMSNRSLLSIANYVPTNEHDLLSMPSVGRTTFDRYGGELLDITQKFAQYLSEGKISESPIGVKDLMHETETDPDPEPKVNTVEISFNLFRQGLTVAEIAARRELKEGTITGHLLRYLPSGQVKITDFVTQDRLQMLLDYFQQHPWGPDSRLTKVVEDCGGKCSYDDVKVVLAYLDMKEN